MKKCENKPQNNAIEPNRMHSDQQSNKNILTVSMKIKILIGDDFV